MRVPARLWMDGANLMRLRSLAILLALAGCADDYASVFITGVAQPSLQEGGCTYDTGTQLLNGTYDPDPDGDGFSNSSYLLGLSVENSLFPRENGVRAETNGVFVTDAVVTVESTSTGIIAEYRVPASGYIPPGGTEVVTVEAIPASIMVAPDQAIILQISLIGHTQGEIDIETGPFSWPVAVCRNCLFTCTMNEDGVPDDSLGQCSPGSNFALEQSCAP